MKESGMTSSQKIMKKKGRFKAEIDRRLPKEKSDDHRQRRGNAAISASERDKGG